MKYIQKEYIHVFDTPAKKEQESIVSYKIMDLLNKNKYNNIYDFIEKNKTYDEFLNKNELENVVKHFGNTLNEEDYKKILNQIVKLTEEKKSFQNESIKTTNIDNEQYVSYEGNDKKFFLDNSNANLSIERELEELQQTQNEFQTSDKKQNTENMFKELEENKKESLELRYLHDINKELLNEKELELFDIANKYQQNTDDVIRIDIKRGLLIDKSDNIFKIEDIDPNVYENDIQTNEKNFQKTLVMKNNANNN